MRRALLLLPLLAGACVSQPEAPPPPEPPLPPLAAAAMAEWEAWGRIVIEGWPDRRPADTAATPTRFARLVGYWEAVPGAAGVARRLRSLRAAIAATQAGGPVAGEPPPAPDAAEDQPSSPGAAGDAPAAPDAPPTPVLAAATPAPAPEDISLYARPAWSAAFIAALARGAGLSFADLPPATTHARYIDALLARAAADPDGAAFLPYAPQERAPLPGDLICADRSPYPLAHWSQRLADRGRFRPMHCDVVVRSRPGTVEAVGGNVEDLVVLRRLPADAEGRLLPAPPDRPTLLLVLAARP